MPEEPLKSLPAEAKVLKISKEVPLTSLPPEAKIINIQKAPQSLVPVLNDFGAPDNSIKTEEIINRIPDLDEDKKDIIRDLAKRNATTEELGQAIGTLQGKHPHQEGGTKYYTNDRGVPVPLRNDERPPAGYEVASIWGTQGRADDDSPLTTIGKQVYNILPSLAENVVDLVHLPYGAATGKEADWYKTLKNSANYLKMSTSTASQQPLLNTQGIDEFKDVFDPNRWEFNADNVAGTAGQVIKSVGEFLAGGAAIKAVTGVTKASSLAAKTASMFTASYMTNLGEALDAGRSAGLDTKDSYRLASAITVPIALVDLGLGVEGRIFKDQIAKSERDQLIKNLVSGIAKDSEGKITKEALDGAFKSTLIANTSLAKTWLKETGKDVVGEGSQEALQSFIQKSGEQIYDHLSDAEKKKFGTDAFSPKAFADYIQEAVAGAFGGAASGVAYNRIKAITKDKEQSTTAFGLVQKGDEAIKSYKHNINNEFKAGKLTQEEKDNAFTRINAYKEYNDITSTLDLDDQKKHEAFDKTFQKQNLEARMESMGDPTKLHPLKQAEYKGLEKQANDLQKDINDIILGAQVKQATTAGEKTIKDIEKKEEAKKPKPGVQPSERLKAIMGKYKNTPIKEDTRTYDETPAHEFNDESKNWRPKFGKVVQKLKSIPDKKMFGVVYKRNFTHGDKGLNSVLGIQMPDGKRYRFSSSMIRMYPEEHKGGNFRSRFMEERFEKDFIEGTPIGMKVYEVPNKDGEMIEHIKGFRRDNGKFIGWLKKTNSGSYKADDKVKDERGWTEADRLAHIETEAETDNGFEGPEVKPVPVEPKNAPGRQLEVHEEVKPANPAPENKPAEPVQEKPSTNPEPNNVKKDEIQPESNNFGVPQENEAAKENTADRKEPSTGNNSKVNRKVSPGSPPKNGTGKKRKIKHPEKLLALRAEVFTPNDLVLQNFISGAKLTRAAVNDFFYGKENAPEGKGVFKEAIKKKKQFQEIHERIGLINNKSGYTIDGMAHYLWESNPSLSFTTEDYKNAIEEVLLKHNSTTSMARDINERHNKVAPEDFSPIERKVGEALDKIEEDVLPMVEDMIDKAEPLSDKELIDLEKSDDLFGWASDINYEIDDTEYGEDNMPFQKKSSVDGDIEKVVEVIQKNFPKVKVVYDEDLQAAGQLNGNTIHINPYYAGYDTPIHEAAHILLDAMGDHPAVKAAVEQLRGTDLWDETKKSYSKLSEKDLENEVLAEAIGREGANIFDTEVEKSKFQKLLDQIFDWIKEVLGIDRNVAKTLARKIISGQGTKDLEGQSVRNQNREREFTAFSDKYFEYVPINEVLKYATGDPSSVMEQVKRNGITEPVELKIDHTGKALIVKGADKVLAAKEIGIKNIPILVTEGSLNGEIKQAKELPKVEEGELVKRIKEASINDLKSLSGAYIHGFTKVTPRHYELTEKNFDLFEHDIVEDEADAKQRLAKGEILYTFYEDSTDPVILNTMREVNDVGYGNLWAATEKQKLQKTSSFDYFREKELGHDVDEERQTLKEIDKLLNDPEISDDEVSDLEELRDSIRQSIKEARQLYKEYSKEKKKLDKISQAKDLEGFTFEELVEAARFADKHGVKGAKLRLAVYLNNEGVERLRKIDPEIEKKANSKDMSKLNVWMKVLSNVSEHFPPLQSLHRIFEEKYQKQIQEQNKLKEKHERLGKAVIRETNRGLGLISDLFSSDSAKYFNYLDDGGKLRTNTTGLTKAQREYLEFVRDLVKNRNEIVDEDGNILDNTLIKIDKGFWETLKSDGYKEAFLALLPKPSENKINQLGALTSRFDHPYKGKSYSKDFYKATNIFIEDITHVKYMRDFVPVVDGIQQFYKELGSKENKDFDNVIEYMDLWKKSKIYQEPGTWDPKVDVPLRALRGLVSTSVMAFSVPANFWNVIIGNGTAIIKDGAENFAIGLKRLADKRGMAILKEYDVVKTDYDSNPKLHGGKLFETLAFAGLRLGEIQIQGTQFLGKLKKEEYDSFELKDGELVFVGKDKNEIDHQMIKYKNEVSDVQGKYAEKDKGNAMNYEFGKALLQFRVYMPAFFKDKFGSEFINSYGEKKRGTFNYTKEAWQELKDDWAKHGYAKGTWENKQTMSNLKYLTVLAVLTILTVNDDDDDDRKRKAYSVENGLQNMLSVFDPRQMKYLVQSPVAAQGPVTKLIDAMIAIWEGDEKKFKKNAKKIVPYGKITEIIPDKE